MSPGVLPHVTVVSPSTRNADGSVTLDLGRMQAGRAVTRSVTLRNDGAVPATVKFEMSSPSQAK